MNAKANLFATSPTNGGLAKPTRPAASVRTPAKDFFEHERADDGVGEGDGHGADELQAIEKTVRPVMDILWPK